MAVKRVLFSRRWLATVGTGAVTFGLLQAAGDINFNLLFFQFLTTLLNLLISALLGGSMPVQAV